MLSTCSLSPASRWWIRFRFGADEQVVDIKIADNDSFWIVRLRRCSRRLYQQKGLSPASVTSSSSWDHHHYVFAETSPWSAERHVSFTVSFSRFCRKHNFLFLSSSWSSPCIRTPRQLLDVVVPHQSRIWLYVSPVIIDYGPVCNLFSEIKWRLFITQVPVMVTGQTEGMQLVISNWLAGSAGRPAALRRWHRNTWWMTKLSSFIDFSIRSQRHNYIFGMHSYLLY